MFVNAIRLKKWVTKQFADFFVLFDSIPDQDKNQEICDLAVSFYPFLILYCPDKYITQKVYDEAVDDSLTVLEIIPD